MSLVVLEPGWNSRLVDGGRPGTRSLGVPLGGAADRTSLATGNGLVGTSADATALEIAIVGPTLRAQSHVAAVVFGAPFQLRSTHQTLECGKTFTLQPGEQLRIGGTPMGMRAYLCVQGGFIASRILGSTSHAETLVRHEILSCQTSRIHTRYFPGAERSFEEPVTLRVLPGTQASWFRKTDFFEQTFSVTTASNRMGLRLQGVPLVVLPRELVSEPVAPGTVQVTPDGQCIVLGVDGQTIGGYPRIAHVIQADLDCLGQLRPGSRLRFVSVSMSDATTAFRKAQARLREWMVRLQVSLDGWRPDRRLQDNTNTHGHPEDGRQALACAMLPEA